jgi:saccharopine dehydrogenase-like NADP-dependent oxidoreductase
MKAIVLGMGQQGRATIHDLESSELIKEVLVADLFPTEESLAQADAFLKTKGYFKAKTLRLDITEEKDLPGLFRNNKVDIVICMLPIALALTAAQAALDAGIPFVSSNYTYDLAQLHESAIRQKGIILPEMGLDPGIDLVMGRLAVDELDVVHGLYSYGGGVPAPECADTSPIRYKISWVFDRVLDVYVRSSQMIKNGKPYEVPGDKLFHEGYFHEIEFPGVGTVEAYPNGNAERYVEIFGLGDELQEMARFAVRWTGHSAFWRTVVDLGLLEEEPIMVNGSQVSPRAFLSKCLTPHLQYENQERDVALLRVKAWGLKAGKKVQATYDLVDYRDLETGLFAMNRTVGFTSSIGAQMILEGKITEHGVLSPVRHVPPHEFMEEIKARGMKIDCKIEEIN